jgi:hypothetical protein
VLDLLVAIIDDCFPVPVSGNRIGTALSLFGRWFVRMMIQCLLDYAEP